jgi:hypothetical protein
MFDPAVETTETTMAQKQRTTFDKRQRERDRQVKQADKRARRQVKPNEADVVLRSINEPGWSSPPTEPPSEPV